MNNIFADKIIISNNIFTGLQDKPIKGYVAIKDNLIMQVEANENYLDILNSETQIIDFEDELVLPGFVDTHTFFTGYAIFHIGVDLSNIQSPKEIIPILKEYENSKKEGCTLFGHGLSQQNVTNQEIINEVNQKYKEKAVILFAADRSICIMNQKAKDLYGFTPDECYSEAYYKIMREYLNDRDFIEAEFSNYMKLMNSRGVTTVKEMGFDDFYGFDDYLKYVEDNNKMSLRVHFMSQPVGSGINIEYGIRMRDKFQGDYVRFSGYNRMTDGTVASMQGDLREPYEGTDIYCKKEIDYELIEKETLKADENGFRYSLHAQGDGSIHKVLGIYSKCKKVNGKLVNKHAITDMEFSHPKDLEKLGEMGAIGEIYFQIMSLDPGDVVKDAISRTIGDERKKYYWNRRKMLDSGITLSGATDLPLMITDIPESIYHSCGGYFSEGGEAFNKQNTISISEILKAWTLGGHSNLGDDDQYGTLEAGKKADLTVLDQNVFEVPMDKMRNVKVEMTIVNGRIVYQRCLSKLF